jgi:hypothetical protein
MSKSGAKSTINEHIKNIFEEGELIETSCLQKFGISEFLQKTPNSRSSTCSAGHVEAR